ncbi:hypothetical protein D9M72_563660 [compost metagenome]
MAQAPNNGFGVFDADVPADEGKVLLTHAGDEVVLLDRLAKQRRQLGKRLARNRAAVVLGHLAKPFDRDEKHGNRLVGSLRFENGVELRGQRQTVRQAGSGVAGERPAAFGEISLEFGHALRTGFQGVLQSILFVHQTACRFAQPRGVVRELRQADDRVSCQPTGEMIEFGLE